jgi:hypothetical protein
MNRTARVLRTLDPPIGGWERLIARREQRARWAAPSWAALAAGSAAALVLMTVATGRSELTMPLSGARLIGERSQGMGLHALDDARLKPLPSGNPNVQLYWIEQPPAQRAR